MKRAYNQLVVLCFQTLFTYGIGKGEVAAVFCVLHHMKHVGYGCYYLLQRRPLNWTKPLHTPLLIGAIMDLSRGKAQLLAENALLRQQLSVLRRQSKRLTCVAATSGIKHFKTHYHAPRANAICERFLGSVRRECLGHVLITQRLYPQRVCGILQESTTASRHTPADPTTESTIAVFPL